MKKLFLMFALAVAPAATSFAQAAYAGAYTFTTAFTVGTAAGLCGSGPATVSRNGFLALTQYYPSDGSSTYSTGYVTKRGLLVLDPPNALTQIIYKVGRLRFASGTFGTPTTGGNFVMANYY